MKKEEGLYPFSLGFFFVWSFCGKKMLMMTFFLSFTNDDGKGGRFTSLLISFFKNLCHFVFGKQVFIAMLLFDILHMMTRRRGRFMPPPLGIGFFFCHFVANNICSIYLFLVKQTFIVMLLFYHFANNNEKRRRTCASFIGFKK
jgi:hypothetical protein